MGEVPLQVKKAAVNKSGSSWLDDDDSEEEEEEPEPASPLTLGFRVQGTGFKVQGTGKVLL